MRCSRMVKVVHVRTEFTGWKNSPLYDKEIINYT